MSDYKHGAYGLIEDSGNRMSAQSASAIVVVGTAPVNQVALGEGETYAVNRPILVRNIAEAKAVFGYSDDWASFTLCEAMHYFFEVKGVGPLILINVLDPTKAAHKAATATSVSKAPVNNIVTLTGMEKAILDSITVTAGSTAKTKGTDYTVAYNSAKQTVVITGITDLGTDALTIGYTDIKPSGVTSADVIGASDGLGTNTGLYAVKSVYQATGIVPAYLMAPGFSGTPAIHSAMYAVSKKVSGHWDMWMFADLPLIDNETAITLDTAATWKAANGYTKENESVYFPMVLGTDKKQYHLSVLAAANFLELLINNDGIPYHSPSNTDAPIIQNIWLGAGTEGRMYDDEIVNNKLNAHGINSAAYVGQRWAIWGAHAADYDTDTGDAVNVSETNRMMLYYISNDFQQRRTINVDKPMTMNDIASIVAEEQMRLDGLKASGALIFGEASVSSSSYVENSDVIKGDYAFDFRVTATPLAKSLTAVVIWADDGFATYYGADA